MPRCRGRWPPLGSGSLWSWPALHALWGEPQLATFRARLLADKSSDSKSDNETVEKLIV